MHGWDSALLQVRAEETAENMYAAIENVSDVVARKMRKVKEKAIHSGKWEGTAGPRGHSFSKVLLAAIPLTKAEISKYLWTSDPHNAELLRQAVHIHLLKCPQSKPGTSSRLAVGHIRNIEVKHQALNLIVLAFQKDSAH